jgi:hypothetical protein
METSSFVLTRVNQFRGNTNECLIFCDGDVIVAPLL